MLPLENDNQCVEKTFVKKTFVGLAAAIVATGGLGLAGMGLASGTAQAEPGFAPLYHWCPGDNFLPEWGFNFDWFTCHDDHHRDGDGWDHSRDWWQQGGDQGWQPGGDRGWQPQGGDQGWQPRGDQGGDRGSQPQGGDRGGPAPWQPWQR